MSAPVDAPERASRARVLDTLVPTTRRVLLAYLAVAVALFALVALFANADLPLPYQQGVKPARYEGPDLFKAWARFDAGWYRSIAEDGYYFRGAVEQSSVAFFPSYPLAMRAVHAVVGGDMAAVGVLLTFLCGLGVAALFASWCRERLDVRSTWFALAALLLWPYAWYLYGAVYADALFLLAVLVAFGALERDRLWLAALAGALASATRPVGLAVAVGLFVRHLERQGIVRFPLLDRTGRAPVVVEWRLLRPRDATPLLAISGLVAYCLYLWARFDEPFAFAVAQGAPGWGQRAGPHTWFKVELFDRLIHFPDKGPYYTAGIAFQGLLATGVLLLVPWVGRRFGWGYAVYVLAVLAIPFVGSKDFQGIGRYALAAFPAFAVMGRWAAERSPRLAWGAAAVSAGLLALLCSAYARGAYVA